MRKYDRRKKLNWFQKIIERLRLATEITDMEMAIERKKKETKGNILDYKRSGVPVMEINIAFKKKALEELKKPKSKGVDFDPIKILKKKNG